MGCGASTHDASANPEEREANKAAEKALREAKKEEKRTIRMLLLGAGESGKSTICKQFLMTQNQFPQSMRLELSSTLKDSVGLWVHRLTLLAKKFDVSFQNKELADTVLMSYTMMPPPEGTLESCAALYADPALQTFVKQHRDLVAELLPPTAFHFLENIQRYTDPNFVASDEECLLLRLRTTGIVEYSLVNNTTGGRLTLVDVGGQRSERRKWIHYFNCATAIIYVASLSEYDQRLAEDSKVNRMQESLDLFENLTSLGWFEHCYIILFLNKYDLFLEKIKKSPLSAHWPEYQESDDPEKAIDFIRSRYCALNKSKKMYVHITTATDTRNIEHVFGDVRTSAFSATLDGSY
mmetsp:Transcript_15192/g.38612  ORF Transcript_15192/g.38612 Transcript_15192/m.38612 type:complete len:352 (-) Transcript_15192:167-1222(-)